MPTSSFWLVVFGFNGSLRQCFSLYRAVSKKEGERQKKRYDERGQGPTDFAVGAVEVAWNFSLFLSYLFSECNGKQLVKNRKIYFICLLQSQNKYN